MPVYFDRIKPNQKKVRLDCMKEKIIQTFVKFQNKPLLAQEK
jgi:hypothetical protein